MESARRCPRTNPGDRATGDTGTGDTPTGDTATGDTANRKVEVGATTVLLLYVGCWANCLTAGAGMAGMVAELDLSRTEKSDSSSRASSSSVSYS